MNIMPVVRMEQMEAGDMTSLQDGKDFLRKILLTSPDCIKILDASGAVCYINEPGLSLMEIDRFSFVEGRHWATLWPEHERERISGAIASALMGQSSRFDAFCPTANGTPKWWDVTVTAVEGQMDEPILIAMSRDITERVLESNAKSKLLEEKDALLAEKDLLMQEIHHRVKNSLQLVQGLLGIQSRSAGSEAASRQLQESAARVRTISSMHDRLYRTAAALDVEIKPYLLGLVNELQSGMATTLQGRAIIFESEDAIWTAADVPALGLVLTELVTNALKYGEGTVRVSFHQQHGQQAVLSVEDEGPGLPDNFDPLQSKGLGMKLVTSLVRDRNGRLDFGRLNGRTRFVATMPGPALQELLQASLPCSRRMLCP